MSESSDHPCIRCGACCATFRVAFYWREAEPDGIWQVPRALTVDLDSVKRCMKGTENKHQPKCAALNGRIGKRATCSIYDNRPTPCRAFSASYEDGVHRPRCDEARKAHGLVALRREDFKPTEFKAESKPENKPKLET